MESVREVKNNSASATVRRKRRLRRKLVNPQLVDFIEQLQSYEYIPEITRVAKDLSMHASSAWKLMNNLKRRGFLFSAVINLHRLGFEYIMLFYRKYLNLDKVFRGTLRFYYPVIPRGTFLTYLAPRGEGHLIPEAMGEALGVEPEATYVVRYSITGKPDLKRYLDIATSTLTVDWDALVDSAIRRPRESVPKEVVKEFRLDLIDLFIVKELEKDPFISLKKVTKRLNEEVKPKPPVNYIRVLRHYKGRIEGRGITAGIKIRAMPVYREDYVSFTAVLRGNTAVLHKVGKELLIHPFFNDAFYIPEEGVSLILGLVPSRELMNLSRFLDRLGAEGLVKDWDLKLMSFLDRKIYAIPYAVAIKPLKEMLELYRRGRPYPEPEEL